MCPAEMHVLARAVREAVAEEARLARHLRQLEWTGPRRHEVLWRRWLEAVQATNAAAIRMRDAMNPASGGPPQAIAPCAPAGHEEPLHTRAARSA